MGQPDLDQLAVNTIRFLAADAVQQANSGHPGLPMGAAPMAYVLWTRHLKHCPAEPAMARSRPLRALGGPRLDAALRPAPPHRIRPLPRRPPKPSGSGAAGPRGIPSTTSRPASRRRRARSVRASRTRSGSPSPRRIWRRATTARATRSIDHHTYVIASDGDLMEGVASEACSLAGHLALGKLIVLYDQNHISLSGSTSLCFTEDVGARFAAYGWHVQHVDRRQRPRRHRHRADRRRARAARTQPSLILVRTMIGYGAPHKQNTFEAHGSPLGPDELRAAKENLGWPREPAFLDAARGRGPLPRPRWRAGSRLERDWDARLRALSRRRIPTWRASSRDGSRGELPDGLGRRSADVRGRRQGHRDPQGVGERDAARWPHASRSWSAAPADLNPSTFTWLKKQGDFEAADREPGRRAGRRSAVPGVRSGATSTSASASTPWARR